MTQLMVMGPDRTQARHLLLVVCRHSFPQPACVRACSTADHTPPAHDLDKLGAVTQLMTIDDHLLLLIYQEEQAT
jgi:hypothetical protein